MFVFFNARCMALSTAVFVGESAKWLPELVERSKKLKVSAGHEAGADLGPVISPAAKERICSLVQSGLDEGAKCLLDGRNIVVPGYENGNFVGPTILADVKVRKFSKEFFSCLPNQCFHFHIYYFLIMISYDDFNKRLGL